MGLPLIEFQIPGNGVHRQPRLTSTSRLGQALKPLLEFAWQPYCHYLTGVGFRFRLAHVYMIIQLKSERQCQFPRPSLCRHDRLLEVQETIRRLEEHGAFSPAERWTQVWCLGLPGKEEERELLRRIESFPHEDQPIPHFALGLEEMAKLARQWLPSCASFEQRRLARGLEIVLRLGLEALGLEARGLRA